MKNTLNLKKAASEFGLVASSLLILLAACGGGGGGTSTTPPATTLGFEGSAIKGPVSAATVNIDSNNDGVCGGAGDAPAVTTNGDGFFTFPTVTAEAHSVCVTGGTDTLTGADLTGTTLTAPPSANPVVTPLTTLVDGQVRASGGNIHSSADVAAAAKKIAQSLELTASQVLPATPSAALSVEMKANAVQAMLSGAARSIASVASGATVTSLYPAASRGAASAVANATTTGLTAAWKTLPITKESVRQAVIQAQAESEASAFVAALSPVMVSEIAAPALAASVQAIVSDPSGVTTPQHVAAVVATENAKIEELASAMNQISSLMTPAAANVLIPGNAAMVNDLAAAVMSAATNGLPAAAANLESAANAVVAACVAQGVPLNPIVVTWKGTVFSSPTINTVAGSLSSATVSAAIHGNPPTLASETSVLFNATEVPVYQQQGSGRELWLLIDKVNLANNNGTLTVTVPASAKLYAYGRDAAGTTYRAVLANTAATVLTSLDNVITFDWTAAMTALEGQPGFVNPRLVRGDFYVTATMSGMNGTKLYMDNASVISPLPAVAMTAPAAAGFPNGGSFSGKRLLTILVTVN